MLQIYMQYTARQYAQALYLAISEAAPADQDKILDNFVAVLKQNQDLGMLDEIEAEMTAFDKQSQGIKTATVTTAKELSKGEEEKIIKELNQYLGSEVRLKKQIDEGLIGGVVIRVDDQFIDGSVKRQLQDLKNKLIM